MTRAVSILLVCMIAVTAMVLRLTVRASAEGYPQSIQIPPEKMLETFLGMRQFAYCDRTLGALAAELPPNDPMLAKSASALKEGRYADALSQLQEPELREACRGTAFYWIALAQALRQTDHLKEARDAAAAITALPRQESRMQLQGYSLLRELGQQPDATVANNVLGVVVEIGMRGNTVLISGYADGDARFLMSRCLNMIGEMTKFPEIVQASRNLCATASALVSSMPIDPSHPLPSDGEVHFSVLTPSGIHVAEEGEPALHDQSNHLHKLFAAMNDLLTGFRHIDESHLH